MKIRTLVVASFLAALPALAATPVLAADAPKAAAVEPADGVITKIDKSGAKATIKHGEIKSVGMGAMTMTFKFQDPAALEKVAVGDKVKFQVKEIGGDYVVTAIEKAK